MSLLEWAEVVQHWVHSLDLLCRDFFVYEKIVLDLLWRIWVKNRKKQTFIDAG